jgi:hypothetical protein
MTADAAARGAPQAEARMSRFGRMVLLAQGSYYLLTGVWPLVSIGTFEAVTGPKTGLWLVRMVGILAAVIGFAILSAARACRVTREIAVLSAGSAPGFASIDLVYGLTGVISRIYLADAAIQAGIIVSVLTGLRPYRSGGGPATRP